eukprot:g4302.t1
MSTRMEKTGTQGSVDKDEANGTKSAKSSEPQRPKMRRRGSSLEILMKTFRPRKSSVQLVERRKRRTSSAISEKGKLAKVSKYKWVHDREGSSPRHTNSTGGKKQTIASADGRDSTILESIVYGLDNYLSNPKARSLGLLFLGLTLIIASGFLHHVVSEDSLLESIWKGWTFLADPGTHADVDGPLERLSSLIITWVGILFFAAIVGFVCDGITEKMENLKEGRSRVIENGHTLILGWTDKTIPLVIELAEAMRSEGGGVIVIMSSDKLKSEMEGEVDDILSPETLKGTQIIVRKGNAMLTSDLLMVSAHQAKATIVLAQDSDDAQTADSQVLRIILSMRCLKKQMKGSIIAEMRDIDNMSLIGALGGDKVTTICSHDIVGRLMIMTCMQPMLSPVFDKLLGFEGNEFYLKHWPELVGLTYGEIMSRFEDAIPIGIRIVDEKRCEEDVKYGRVRIMRSHGADIRINPPPHYVYQHGDELIVLAEDDDTYAPAPKSLWERRSPNLSRTLSAGALVPKVIPSEILMCGWRRDIDDLLVVLEDMVEPGSVLHMINKEPIESRHKEFLDGGLDVRDLNNIRIKHYYGDPSIKRFLEDVPIETIDSCLILADYTRENDTLLSDSFSLATQLLVSEIQRERHENAMHNRMSEISHNHKERMTIVCEILDARTENLLDDPSLRRSEDTSFLQSNDIVSKALSMIGETKEVKGILMELLDPEGCEIYIRKVSSFVGKGSQHALSFFDLMGIVYDYRAILLGFLRKGELVPVLNPAEKTKKHTWNPDDLLITIAFESHFQRK